MAQYTYNKFIKANTAPSQAKFIGIYDSGGTRVGEIQLGDLENDNGTPLYKFGILSDIHVDTTDYNYSQYLSAYPYSDEGMGDFRRALRWLRDVEEVDMICASGDLSQYGTDSEFELSQNEIMTEIPNIPFYTCTGNHDCYGTHSGAATFMNYFNNRTIDTTTHTLSASTEYANSFFFDHTFQNSSGESQTDTFVFFSMYNYSAGNAYLSTDLEWLSGLLSHKTSNRVFLFTHLFFPDYAGNLGRVNGSGGIYPTGNWMSGEGLTSLSSLLSGYKNVYWFSGHSHWKWDLQKFQDNINVARYGLSGAWTVHIPSCALPIDSDYTNTSTETETNRVEKPLETQGGVVDVYDDRIVVRGIDFNINSSQNGDTTQGYSGDTYVRYLPIAHYVLKHGLYDGEGEEVDMGLWELGGFSGTGETAFSASTQVIRSQYIPVSASNMYLLTTTAPIGDQSDPDSIRELSIWCFSGDENSKTSLGRISNQSYNTTSSKWGSTSTSLNYFDKIYSDEDISDGIFNVYPEATYIRMRLYRMGTESDPEGTGGTITVEYGDRVQLTEVVGERHPETAVTRPSSDYVIYKNFALNGNKTKTQYVTDPWADYGDDYVDYVAVTFDASSEGYWVTSPTYSSSAGTAQTATIELSELKVYSGHYSAITFGTTTETTLPANVGFYNGSASTKYQITDGFSPSTTESSSQGRVQFQTSSSYSGGTITILMKLKVNFS